LGSEDSGGRLPPGVHSSPSTLPGIQADPISSRSTEALSALVRSGFSSGEGGRGSHSRQAERLLLHLLPDHQEVGGVEADHQPEASERVHTSCSFQDGDASLHLSSDRSRVLGGNPRSQGRLPARPCSSRVQEVAEVQVGRPVLPVQGTALRPVHVTPGVHPRHQGGGGTPQVEGLHNLRVPGRLPDISRVTRGAAKGSRRDPPPSDPVGIPDQCAEVQPDSVSTAQVSGGNSRFQSRKGHSYPRKGRVSKGVRPSAPCSSGGPGIIVSAPAGSVGESHRHGPLVSPPHERYPATSVRPLQTLGAPFDQDGPGAQVPSPFNSVVAGTPSSSSWDAVSSSSSRPGPNNGCLQVGLGSSLGRAPTGGCLVSPSEEIPYQHPRALGRLSGPSQIAAPSPGQVGIGSHRQRHGGCIPVQARRDSQSFPLSGGMQGAVLVRGEIHFPDGGVPSRGGQRPSGRSVEGRSSDHSSAPVEGVIGGVAPTPVRLPLHLYPSGSPSYRSICVQTQPAAPELLFLGGRPGGNGDQRHGSGLVGPSGLCISTNRNGATSSGQIESDSSLQNSASGTPVAETTLVPPPPGALSGRARPPSNPTRPSVDIRVRSESPSQDSRVPSADCMDHLRRSFLKAGFSGPAADIASQARRQSTRSTYFARFQRFERWCQRIPCDPYLAPVARVADFLTEVFRGGAQPRTIQGYRAALAAIHHGFSDGSTISTSPLLAQLLKGMLTIRPPTRKLLPSWDLCLVLQFFSIKQEFMKFSDAGVSLLPRAGFLAKNQTISFTPQPVLLPDLRKFTGDPEDQVWCPVKCLKFYLARTKGLRAGEDQLFISSTPPHQPISRQTLSRWIVQIIKRAYSSLGRALPGVKAHDTRAMAASWALYSGVSLDNIIENVGWQSASTFQQAYLRDVPIGVQRRASSAVASLKAGSTAGRF